MVSGDNDIMKWLLQMDVLIISLHQSTSGFAQSIDHPR